MLLSRTEMTFDFGGHKLTPGRDREILRWIFSQFLYGEVTGIQVGHWLYAAPNLESARFLAKQALEELQHVGNFVHIMQKLELGEPLPAHPVLRWLATGMMGDDWAEHVALEMATGEGFVLTAFYALIDTLDAPEAVAIMQRAARQEESHVQFGEAATQQLLREQPALRAPLLGANLVWMWGVERLAGYIERKLPREHPVLSQVAPFLAHALGCAELRLVRLGMVEGPLRALPRSRKAALLTQLAGSKLGHALARKRPRLTDTYLADPAIRSLLGERDAR
jgi:hypothetical protein